MKMAFNYYEQDLLAAVKEAELIAIHLRELAAAVLRDKLPSGQLYKELNEGLLVDVSESSEGWLRITLPTMLPRRGETDRARFLLGPLNDAIHAYYTDRPKPRFHTCIIVYEHIYGPKRSRQQVTDHDNLELKHCQDTLEAAFLTNDSSNLCSAFQCSHRGKCDSTRIWILTPDQFTEWLSAYGNYWRKDTENTPV
jgi:hypothetical protein